MPTEDQVWRHVKDLERDYPSSLPERLTWWKGKLGIDRVRLFRLLGLTAAEARRTPESDLERIVSQEEDRAELIDEMLGQILASYDYDVPAMSAAFHRPAGPDVAEATRMTRRRDEVVRLPYRPRPEQRAGILLNEIVAGGPSALSALRAYLMEPATGE